MELEPSLEDYIKSLISSARPFQLRSNQFSATFVFDYEGTKVLVRLDPDQAATVFVDGEFKIKWVTK